jgi:hypothetical protein
MIAQTDTSAGITFLMVLAVSLYIPAMAKVAQRAETATEVFYSLRRHLFISIRGLVRQHDVVALIQATWDSYPENPAPGRELSREIVAALNKAGYVSILGRTWGRRFLRRG